LNLTKKGIFWENIKKDNVNGKIDCYEGRLEEIVNSCTDVSRKYWKNQQGIVTRSRRTQLFVFDIFKHRRKQKCDISESFGNRNGTFAKKVLRNVRNRINGQAGYQF
jgi:hypothetical protein